MNLTIIILKIETSKILKQKPQFLIRTERNEKKLRKNIIVGQLNINSLRNNFFFVKELLSHNLDLLIINETKSDDSFPK